MQGNDSFRLVVRRGPQPNQVYDLNKDIISLGRDITNDITINDPEVSRHHMRLTRGAGGFTVEDLASTNGTFVNGQRLTGARPLRPGDMIGLGETVTLGYEAVSGAGAPEGGGEMPATSQGPSARQAQPPQQQPSPYAQPQQPQQGQPGAFAPPGGQGQPGQQPFQQPQQPPSPYEQQSYGYNEAPYGAPPAAPPQVPGQPGQPGVPGQPGYEYDPYEVREEEPRSTTRWILIGCVGLTMFCCCGTLVGGFIIDQACLYEQVPLLSDVLNAFGWAVTC